MAFAPLAGMIAGPLLEGAGVGAALGLGASGLGALTSGVIGLGQGHGLLGAGLDALGGYGGAGAVGNLGATGAVSQAAEAASAGQAAGNEAAQGILSSQGISGAGNIYGSGVPLSPEFLDATRAAAQPAAAQGAANALAGMDTSLAGQVASGAKDLTNPGGLARFKDITGSSALSSLGTPAAGLAIGALTPPTNYGIAPNPYAGSFGSFTPMSELRRRAQSNFAEGGIASLNPMDGMFDARRTLPGYDEPSHETYKKGGFLNGPGDGMSDSIPATIDDKQPARLADGEFVVPADVVSHLGNGSTKAGAQRLYAMMDKVRKARTGTTKQGKQIQPERYMPA